MTQRPAAPIVTVLTITMDCPHCGETVISPGGSLYLTGSDISTLSGGKSWFACPCCGGRIRVPPVTKMMP